jgi:hypothetical protein
MLEKLFVRVRSWLHIDGAAVPAGSTAVAGVPGPAIAPNLEATRKPNGKEAGAGAPPPLPAEAFSLVMEAQPESGMVITESGIIIIDPGTTDSAELAAHKTVPPDAAWALPVTTSSRSVAAPSFNDSSSGQAGKDDWDSVLARARAQLAKPEGATPGPTKRK